MFACLRKIKNAENKKGMGLNMVKNFYRVSIASMLICGVCVCMPGMLNNVSAEAEPVEETVITDGNYGICWGDSLTAFDTWTSLLEADLGIPLLNCGVGGETSRAIAARQGADPIMIDDVVIPGDCSDVVVAQCEGADIELVTEAGFAIAPFLQGDGNFNPCYINGVACEIRYEGDGYPNLKGEWIMHRIENGEDIVIEDPTPLIPNTDVNFEKPYLMIVFVGGNDAYDEERAIHLVERQKSMIEHTDPENYLVIGLTTGNEEIRASYDEAMEEAFGDHFLSLRRYLTEPIYENDTVVSCRGLQEAGIEPNEQDIELIQKGRIPLSLLLDFVHFNKECGQVVEKCIYNRLQELGIAK